MAENYVALGSDLERALDLAVKMKEERDALQAFKDYVHKRLDDAGVPTHPEGEHSKAGCRIGDRLDIVLSGRDFQNVIPDDGSATEVDGLGNGLKAVLHEKEGARVSPAHDTDKEGST